MPKQAQIDILARNLRVLRACHDLSLPEMAARLHCSVRTLRLLESGVLPRQLRVDFLLELHRAFGIPPAAMFSPYGAEDIL